MNESAFSSTADAPETAARGSMLGSCRPSALLTVLTISAWALVGVFLSAIFIIHCILRACIAYPIRIMQHWQASPSRSLPGCVRHISDLHLSLARYLRAGVGANEQRGPLTWTLPDGSLLVKNLLSPPQTPDLGLKRVHSTQSLCRLFLTNCSLCMCQRKTSFCLMDGDLG